MMHTFHQHCPGYDSRQILHDGCKECAARGKDFAKWAAHADDSTWERAWRRTFDLYGSRGNRDAIGLLAEAEIGILQTLWAFMVMLERRGVRMDGQFPAVVGFNSVEDMLREGAPES